MFFVVVYSMTCLPHSKELVSLLGGEDALLDWTTDHCLFLVSLFPLVVRDNLAVATLII